MADTSFDVSIHFGPGVTSLPQDCKGFIYIRYKNYRMILILKVIKNDLEGTFEVGTFIFELHNL